MAVLKAADRNALPDSAFAVITKDANGDKVRKYPIPDAAHAANALARVTADGTPEEKAAVVAFIKKNFPAVAKNSNADLLQRATGGK